VSERGGTRAGVGEIVEYTDPACPWSWGAEPVFRLLRARTQGRVRWRRVYGILFDEDDDPAPDPVAEAASYVEYVARTAAYTRAPFTNALRWLTTSSWPASLAAKAAERQGPLVAERVLRRLRESTFVAGTPADTAERALSAVEGVPGLDVRGLSAAMAQRSTTEAVRADWREARDPLPAARAIHGEGPHSAGVRELAEGVRYSMPTLVIKGPGGAVTVPGWRGTAEYEAGLARAGLGERGAGRLEAGDRYSHGSGQLPPYLPWGAAETLERYRSMTAADWELLTGGAAPPAHAVRVETGNGPLWLHPSEAEAAGHRYGPTGPRARKTSGPSQ
jgi:predicted DsbA family dithiol-disulfide isomerase